MRHILTFLLITGLGGFVTRSAEAQVQQKFIITESGQPFSFDPLDADTSNNLPVARMLYLTPLEVSSDDRLTSAILESFSYDTDAKTVRWTVRNGLKFSDGTAITPNDVAFAVARMAVRRPGFPVIKEIVGMNEWVRSPKPLHSFPRGLKVDRQTISISFAERIDHPLFRFCLELFSIIPRRSVDLDTGNLLTPQPPTSGYYSIAERDSNSIVFARRHEFPTIDGKSVPSSIRFVYAKARPYLDSLAGSLDGDTVIMAGDGAFQADELVTIDKKYELRNLPKAKFAVLLLNPDAPAFRSRECRQLFAASFREAYAKIISAPDVLEGSISPRIVTGYLPLEELKKSLRTHDDKTFESCKAAMRAHKVRLGGAAGNQGSPFQLAAQETLRQFGQTDVEPIMAANLDELDDLYLNDKVHIKAFSSGLWALDPFGDLQMLFTPGLHKPLSHMQKDAVLQQMIAKLRTELPPAERIELASKLNRHLFEDAVFNVFRHSRRFYVSKKGGGFRSLNASITSPTPWQVFERQ